MQLSDYIQSPNLMPSKIFDKSFNRIRTVYDPSEVYFVQLGDRIAVELKDDLRHAEITDSADPDQNGTVHTLSDGGTVQVNPSGAATFTPVAPNLTGTATSFDPTMTGTASIPASDTPSADTASVPVGTEPTSPSDYDAGFALAQRGEPLADDAPDAAKQGYADAIAAQNSPSEAIPS